MKFVRYFSLTFIIFLINACSLVASLNCQRPWHDPYSDELSARVVLPRGIDIPTDAISAEAATEALFASRGWFVCPSKHTGDHGIDGLYTYMTKDGPVVVLCETKFRDGTTRLDLSRNKCAGCSLGGEEKECYQMSRRWSYNAVSKIVVEAEDYCVHHDNKTARTCARVCPEVRKHVLGNIYNIIRLGIVFSGDKKCRFHILAAVDAEGRDQREAEIRNAKAVWAHLGIPEKD